jgi:hypothetical protein
MAELTLPDGVEGSIVDIQFADVTADMGAELLILRPDELVVVDSDVAVGSGALSPGIEAMTTVDANDDGFLDVVLISSVADQTAIMVGDGLGSFGAPTTWTAPGLLDALPIDWPTGGPNELLALRSDGSGVVVLSELNLAIPTLTPLPVSLADIDKIDVGRFDDPMTPADAIAFSGCMFELHYAGGGSDQAGVRVPNCRMATGDYDGWFGNDIFTLSDDGVDSILRGYYVTESVQGFTFTVDDVFGDLSVVRGTGLVLLRPDAAPTQIQETDGSPFEPGRPYCRRELQSLPITTRLAVGDVDGDGYDELAVIDTGGVLSVWRNAAPTP